MERTAERLLERQDRLLTEHTDLLLTALRVHRRKELIPQATLPLRDQQPKVFTRLAITEQQDQQ